jgi:alcohol dehydrogenase (nicotinoprotein)
VRTRAAVLRTAPSEWEITELDLDEPKDGEVLVRMMASGLCHSDDHVSKGDAPIRLPLVGGHEGAGIVERVGPGVTRLAPGDHIVTIYVPVCGRCRWCSTGRQGLCVEVVRCGVGCLKDETFRFHDGDSDLGGMCVLGTFSQYAVIDQDSCLKIDSDLPFEVASLVGCGVVTGWSSSVHLAHVRPGDTVVVFGVGGVGSAAVQGARYAGARNVVAVDPVPFKREMAKVFGATHTSAPGDEAQELVASLTGGDLADHAILTVGVLDAEVTSQAVAIVGKAGQVSVTAVGRMGDLTMRGLSAGMLVGPGKRIEGAVMGKANPLHDVPRLFDLYRAGDLKLDELITRRYGLDEINDGYRDLLDGKNIRGVLVHEH